MACTEDGSVCVDGAAGVSNVPVKKGGEEAGDDDPRIRVRIFNE